MSSDIMELDATQLEDVRFGRNRVLKALGTAFFGLVAHRLVTAAPAEAQHNTPPGPCFGFPRCHYCYGDTCTQYCHWHSVPHSHCPSGGQCWYGCANGLLYRCCDWHEQFPGHEHHHCLCRSGSLGFC
jgi:hypothetical protein